MVNVTNRTDVAMRLIPLKLFLGHGISPSTKAKTNDVIRRIWLEPQRQSLKGLAHSDRIAW
jgi:hypothetical protein